jgi:hypothetical protein
MEMPTSGQAVGAAGFIAAYGQAQAQQAAAIQQQTGYLLQARNTLAVAEVNAQYSKQYANIQAGRLLKRADIEARNFQIAGNTIQKNLRATNANVRARAAAAGIDYAGGSAGNIQLQNVQEAMFDVGIADLNALTARVLGFEDATAMIQSAELQDTLNLFSARQQSAQYKQAGSAARQTGGLMATQTLIQGGIDAYKTIYGEKKT